MKINKIDLSKVYKPRQAKKRRDRGYYDQRAKKKGPVSTTEQFGYRAIRGAFSQPEFRISVIIPAFNAKEYILEAMESVMAQTIDEPIEMIVIDDCSTDGTYEIAEDYARRYPISKERCITLLQNSRNIGVASSRNRAVSRAAGEYVAFLDADDWWDADKLKLQYEHLVDYCRKITLAKERAELVGKKKNVIYPVLSCTARELADQDGNSVKKIIGVPETISYEMLLKTNYIPCSSVLLKREVARKIPMKRDDMHEDYLAWLQITKQYGPAIGLNKPLVFSRQTWDGKSRNKINSAIMQYNCYRYMKINPVKSCWYMLHYIFEGIQKYK